MKVFKNNINKIACKSLSILLIIILLIIHQFLKNEYNNSFEQYHSSNFVEISSLESDIKNNPKMFDEFRKINCNNKLINKNNKFVKSDNPDISIIMTNYNQENYIHKGLRSIQNQSVKNIEIIIVDDCSIDNSIEIIKEYQNEDPRILLISHDTNEGKIKSRTDAIKKAKGRYITIIDGDDALIHRDILKHSLFIALKADLDAVEFKLAIYKNGKLKEVINDYNYTNITNIIYQPELRTKFIWIYETVNFYIKNRIICGKLIKNELFKKILIYIGSEYTEDYINDAEDTIMAVSLFHLANSYYIMKEIGYYYSFDHEKNAFKNVKNKICKSNDKIKTDYGRYQFIKFFIEKGIENEKEKAAAFNEITKVNHKKYFNKKLDKRIYNTMILVYNKIIELGSLTPEKKFFILNLKNKTLQKMKEYFI